LTLLFGAINLFLEYRPIGAYGHSKSLFSAEVALRGFFYFHGGRPMLVLSRRLGEQIVIGGEIRITVVAVQGNKVRIGITAPPDIRVDREEISQRLQGRACARAPGMPPAKSPRSFDSLKNNLPDPARLLPLRGI
jgi:carbon storage regulator